jgi:hypothetical protein
VSDRSKGAGGLGGGQRARTGASAPVKAASPAARPAAPPFRRRRPSEKRGIAPAAALDHSLAPPTTRSPRRAIFSLTSFSTGSWIV